MKTYLWPILVSVSFNATNTAHLPKNASKNLRNAHLRQELAFYGEKHTDTIALYTKALKALNTLQDTLHERAEKQAMSEKSLLNYRGIPAEEFNPEISIL